MKNYKVSVNTNSDFQNADFQTIGTCSAKNKAEAIEKVYTAFWGAKNDASIDTRMTEAITPSMRSKMRAEIEI